jgi:hypothetical protein
MDVVGEPVDYLGAIVSTVVGDSSARLGQDDLTSIISGNDQEEAGYRRRHGDTETRRHGDAVTR